MIHNTKRTFAAIAVASVVFVSCKKETTSPNTVTEEEAVAIISESITDSGSGLIVNTTASAEIATIYKEFCGLNKDSSVSRSKTGATASWNASLAWEWLLSCSNNIPSLFTTSFTGTSAFSGTRMSSSDQVAGEGQVTGLEPSSASFAVNMSLLRNGTQTSKIGNKNSFTSTIELEASALTVNKTTKQVTAGSVQVAISGATTGGKSFSYNGTFVFSGNKSGVLTLGNGNTYTINW